MIDRQPWCLGLVISIQMLKSPEDRLGRLPTVAEGVVYETVAGRHVFDSYEAWKHLKPEHQRWKMLREPPKNALIRIRLAYGVPVFFF